MSALATRKTPLMQLLEVKYGESIDQLLSRLYIDEHKTMEEISTILGISLSGVSRWMERMDIPVRTSHPA